MIIINGSHIYDQTGSKLHELYNTNYYGLPICILCKIQICMHDYNVYCVYI